MRTVRSRRPAHGALAALALCGVLALAGCQGGDEPDPGAAGSKPTAGPSGPSVPTPASTAAPTPTKAAPKPSASGTPTKKPTSAAPKPTCDHVMPIAPDLIALYRYTPEGGSHNLIVRHGNWSCGGSPDAAGVTFVPVGEETYFPIADGAEITATAPIVTGSASKPITVDQLVAWVLAHPNSGLPFRYHLNAAGAIDTLAEIHHS
ncbi:hypothetical protein AB0P15_11150 [Streptomyces sp. NPDC087917]|uniref:hypothetical protein n=1 Tax=Streptomyces sp. NPDC087917 TaxID=3155060 RepID=UPI00343AB63F